MKKDIEIAQNVTPVDIAEIAKKIGIDTAYIERYGDDKAKISLDFFNKIKSNKEGSLILVSAITPTPAGEGKTTTSIGIHDGFIRLGYKSVLALREPSLGPVFGVKGGATGGGYAQVIPMEDINLHFTGDINAVEKAHNLIAAAVDNEIHWGTLRLDPRRIRWRRSIDLNDRALRDIVVALGGKANGFPRETGFDITASSEVMAILCLAEGYSDLKKMIGNILIGFDIDSNPIYVRDLKVEGAATVLLKNAIKPNLVQTLEHNPVFIHGGPFANIAQGANSIIATKMALRLGDFAVTETGFAFDLGAEKFFDIVARKAGFKVSVVVLVATIRALKYHGGIKLKDIGLENPEAVINGLPNLEKHYENILYFGVPSVVAINKFSGDYSSEMDALTSALDKRNIPWAFSNAWEEGGTGTTDLVKKIVKQSKEQCSNCHPIYPLDMPIEDKVFHVAHTMYGAEKIDFLTQAKSDISMIKKLKLDTLPICIAKTQKSLSDNPELIGRPKDFLVTVRSVDISSGAGFLVPITGEILRMPGLPKESAYKNIDINDDGVITGLS